MKTLNTCMDVMGLLLIYVGILPTTKPSTSRWLKLLRYIYPRAAFLNMFYIMCVVHATDIYYSWNDELAATEGIIHVFANLMGAVKTGTFLFQAHNVRSLMEELGKLRRSDHREDKGEAEIVQKTERISRRLVLFLPSVMTALATFATVMQLLSATANRNFLFRVRFPYDAYAVPYFELTLLHLSFSMISSINIMGVVDTFVMVILVQTLGRLKVLRYKMENVHSYARRNLEENERIETLERISNPRIICESEKQLQSRNKKYHTSWQVVNENLDRQRLLTNKNKIQREMPTIQLVNSGKSETIRNYRKTVAMNREMEKSLKECVNIHVEITRFVKRWEVIFSPIFTIQLACNLIPTGVMALYLSLLKPFTLDEKGQALSQMLVGCVIQLYVFCYLAKEITDEDSKIKDSVFKCKWRHASKSFKKSMQILISRANVPLVVKAITFIPMSMQSFMTVSQNAYSYYVALLIYIKKRQVRNP